MSKALLQRTLQTYIKKSFSKHRLIILLDKKNHVPLQAILENVWQVKKRTIRILL